MNEPTLEDLRLGRAKMLDSGRIVWINNQNIKQGWQCPICLNIINPDIQQCFNTLSH